MKNYQVFGVLIWMMFALICTQLNQPVDEKQAVEPLRSDIPVRNSQILQPDTLYRFP